MKVRPFTIFCPDCNALIHPKKVDIASNKAECRDCGAKYQFSELMENEEVIDESDFYLEPLFSKIQLKVNEEAVEVHLPMAGFVMGHIIAVPITIGVSFMTFLIMLAFIGHMGLMLGSLFIFGGATIAAWYTLLNGITAKEFIRLSKDGITFQRRSIFKKEVHHFTLAEIEDVKLVRLYNMNYGYKTSLGKSFEYANSLISPGGSLRVPAIVSGKGTLFIFRNAKMIEKLWVVEMLSVELEKFRK